MCDAIGKYAGDINGFVAHVLKNDSDGVCQTSTVSPHHSSGPVASDEILVRRVFSPTHLKNDPLPTLDDSLFVDSFDKGASLQRLPGGWAENSGRLHFQGEEQARKHRSGENGRPQKPDRSYLGVMHLSAREARAEQLAEYPLNGRIRIYDTAKVNDTGHADLVADDRDLNAKLTLKEAKAARKQLRLQLMKLAERRGLYVSPYLGADEGDLLTLGVTLCA